ncbi:MAG: geranylgeranyl reductase family protein [candidate division WOR-3 bacterium]
MSIKDVVICGAGPAGSSLAYFLAREGFDILLLDKAKFPRFKPCAGAFQVSLKNFFPFSLEKVVKEKVFGLFFKKDTSFLEIEMEEPISYIVERKEFDNLLVNKAIENGVEFIDECKVIKIEDGNVFSKGDKFKGKIIVGADGVGSVVRKFCNYGRIKKMIKTISSDIPFAFEKKLLFDFSYTKKGYSWIFPKGDKINIGLGTTIEFSKENERNFYKLLEDYGFPQPKNIYKWTYPIFSNPESLVWKNTILIGDAASLANPLTGGGIYNAVQSAFLASKAISLNLKNGVPLRIYQKMIRRNMYLMFYASKIFNQILEKNPFQIQFLKIIKPILILLTKKLS